MMHVLEIKESTAGYYGWPEPGWGDDIHTGIAAAPVEVPVAPGKQQIGIAHPDYLEILHQFAMMNETANWMVPDWYRPTIGRFRRASRRGVAGNSSGSTRQRLANANDYFHRKATEVFNDKAALQLLEKMYQDVVWDIADFDACQNGIALAKLTAANFAEVGAKIIYITEAGQRFMDSVREHGEISG
jgi:hypothetical protein